MKTIIFIYLILLSFSVSATAVSPDFVEFNGKNTPMIYTPRVDFTKMPPPPTPPEPVNYEIPPPCSLTTASRDITWWAIIDDRLYVKAHRSACEEAEKWTYDPPVFADWVNKKIVLPQGPMIQYIHMGMDSMYGEYLILTVENGIIKDQELCIPDDEINELDEGYGEVIWRPLNQRCPSLKGK